MDRRLEEALKVLGIPAESDRETVASAYRRLARLTHPDVSSDPAASERFAAVAAAYHVVSHAPDPRRDVRQHSFAMDPLQPVGLTDRWSTPVRRRDGGRLLQESWSAWPAGSGHRPVVAGPVVVRRAQPGAGGESRHG